MRSTSVGDERAAALSSTAEFVPVLAVTLSTRYGEGGPVAMAQRYSPHVWVLGAVKEALVERCFGCQKVRILKSCGPFESS